MVLSDSQKKPIEGRAATGSRLTVGIGTLLAAAIAASGGWKLRGKTLRKSKPSGRILSEFKPLTVAEKRLLCCCREGKELHFAGVRPVDRPDAEDIIDAKLIRFLMLGGDDKHPIHEAGIWLTGAWIDGALDLEGVSSSVFLTLISCELDGELRVTDAKLPTLRLEGTRVRALNADRARITGSVFLNQNFSAVQEVRFVGAHISGNLDCDAGEFNARPFRSKDDVGELGDVKEPPTALRLEATVVDGDVLLGSKFSAKGEVRLIGAKIGQNLTCSGGKFSRARPDEAADVAPETNSNHDTKAVSGSADDDNPSALNAKGVSVDGSVYLNSSFNACGGVRLVGADIRGSLYCSGGTFKGHSERDALDAQRMVVKGKFEAKGATIDGLTNFSAARVGSLADCPDQWPKKSLSLDGFHYDRISESADADARIAWLEKQIEDHLRDDFRPQPWEQLIKVLRDMGHPEEAAKVAIRKEELWLRSGQMKPLWKHRDWARRTVIWFEWAKVLHFVLYWLYGTFSGYGYRPLKTIISIIIVWISCSMWYDDAEDYGLFAPTAPAIQVSELFKKCGPPPKVSWTSSQCNLPPEHTAFDAWMYSLDLILPFVDLQQESSWAPATSTENGRVLPSGWALRWLMWFEIIFGWLMSLLLLAALGRVLNRD